MLLLSYIITQADHRLCAVESWVKQHHQTLELATGWKIADKDSLWLDPDTREWHRWSERWLVIRSHALAQRQIKGLEQRVQKAEKALVSLAARPGQDAKILQEKVEQILKHHRVEEYLLVTINKKIQYPKVYEGVGRPSLERPFRRVRKTTLTLSHQRIQTAITLFTTLAGWRLYVTNTPAPQLSLEQAVFYYREQWQPERGFHR